MFATLNQVKHALIRKR